jgi:signal peptidase II
MGKRLLKYLAILLVALGGCGADRQSKLWAKENLKDKPAVTLVKHFVDLGFTENRGMVFGILNGKMPEFAGIITAGFRVLILLALMPFIWSNRGKAFLFLLPFLFFWVGAAGNLVDLFVYGYVIDFIHIQAGNALNRPFYFNLADAFITAGMVLLFIRWHKFSFGKRT